MALYSLDISTGDHAQPLVSGQPHESLNRLASFLKRLAGGHSLPATTVTVRNSGVKASATVTCASVQAADEVVVGGVTFTAVNDATPGTDEFDMSGTNSACATSLAAAINANTTLDGAVTASAANAVVTITADVPGVIGNAVTLTTSNGTRLAATGSGRLASGAESLFTYSR